MNSPESNLLELASKYWENNIRHRPKGKILFFQGDLVHRLYLIKSGVVKISSVSEDGKIYSHGILGAGNLLGVTDFFLNNIHANTAEVINECSLIEITQSEFKNVLENDVHFSKIIMRELAAETKRHTSKAEDLSFLDTQHRLMNSLIKLAKEHGLETEEGITIDANITHEDMGELINANRTTITLCFNKLKKLGYVHTEGRKIVLIPLRHIEIQDQMRASLLSGFIGETKDLVRLAIEEGVDPRRILRGLSNSMNEVDNQFSHDQIELSDVLWASQQMLDALPSIEKEMQKENYSINYLGKVLVGTVAGDIHDIGKKILTMLLKARGFDVVDLGINNSPEVFIDAIVQHQPDILAMSALLTTTQLEMKKVINAIEGKGLRGKVKIMVGGAPTSPKFAEDIGADGYGFEARDGVDLAWGWCTIAH